jgi:hypothetical protein
VVVVVVAVSFGIKKFLKSLRRTCNITYCLVRLYGRGGEKMKTLCEMHYATMAKKTGSGKCNDANIKMH